MYVHLQMCTCSMVLVLVYSDLEYTGASATGSTFTCISTVACMVIPGYLCSLSLVVSHFRGLKLTVNCIVALHVLVPMSSCLQLWKVCTAVLVYIKEVTSLCSLLQIHCCGEKCTVGMPLRVMNMHPSHSALTCLFLLELRQLALSVISGNTNTVSLSECVHACIVVCVHVSTCT